MSDLIRRLREPPFGTETSERNLMAQAADALERADARAGAGALLAEVMPMVIAVEDFINEPLPGRVEHPDVCDYRHRLYSIWSPLCRALALAQPDEARR